jgi:hypothetical protein
MIKIEVNLDSVVVENCTLGTDAWLPWVEYPSGNAAKDIYNITAYFPNGTVTAVPEGTGTNQWYYDSDWPCEVECDMLNATQFVNNTILEVTYLGWPKAEISYTASLPTVYAEHNATYSEFLTDLSDPVCSDWDELLPNPTRAYHCIAWNDTDASGNLTVSDYMLLQGPPGNLTYHVDHLATDLIVDQEHCICKVDPSHEYYCEPLIVDVAGFPHPERSMCPWHGSEMSVPLPHKVENATYSPPSLIHDVTVVSVTPSTYEVLQGETMNTSVVVKNNGDVSETFNVTVYANDTMIDMLTVYDLAPENQTTLTFLWDTTDVPLGNYTIKAEASVVPGETNAQTIDNIYINGIVNIIPEFPPAIVLLLVTLATLVVAVMRKKIETKP